jgi:hypothetical protein
VSSFSIVETIENIPAIGGTEDLFAVLASVDFERHPSFVLNLRYGTIIISQNEAIDSLID